MPFMAMVQHNVLQCVLANDALVCGGRKIVSLSLVGSFGKG